MKTTVKITLLLLVLCASCFYVFTKERRPSKCVVQNESFITEDKENQEGNTPNPSTSPSQNGQINKRDLSSRTPRTFEKVEPVTTAIVGRNITLQCVTKFTIQDNDILEWSKGDEEILIVKNRKVQCEATDRKRFHLAASTTGLKRRIASLNISHVKHTDSGNYSCCIKNIEFTERDCINQTVVVQNESPTPGGQINTPNPPTSPPQNDVGVAVGVAVAVVGVAVGVLITIYFKKKKTNNSGSNNQSEPPLLHTTPSVHVEMRSAQENEEVPQNGDTTTPFL